MANRGYRYDEPSSSGKEKFTPTETPRRSDLQGYRRIDAWWRSLGCFSPIERKECLGFFCRSSCSRVLSEVCTVRSHTSSWAKGNFLSDKELNSAANYQKIDVSLASRPYRASSNVMRQIEVSGATRNLVICQIGQDLNEEGIREQLDHIHNLHVIEVTFSDGAAIISLNAVGVALYARTCLRSRATYKKCKIDFYPDGCAQPLPTQYIKASTSAVERPPLKTTQSLSSRFHSLENRFQLLEMEDTENDSEETATAGMMSQESQSSGGVPLNT